MVSRGSAFSVLAVVATLLSLTSAAPSCCEAKARLARQRFIADPDAVPPDFDSEGRPRLVADHCAIQPEEWDEEDDGPWEPPLAENEDFSWKAPRVPNPDYAPPPFADELRTEVEKALPWVVVGVLVTAALEALQLPFASLGGVLARAGPLGGAAVGLATPLCSCGALPVAAGLAASAPLRAVVAFLTASQSAGLDSAAITRGRLAAAFKAAVGSARDAFPPVLLGLAGGAAALRWLPPLPQAHDDYADGLLPRVAVLAAALPLQLCEHSTVTAARAIRDAGGSPGLAFAFLLSAPATNLPSLLLLVAARRERARAAALRVAAAIAATALALSYAVDFAGADLFVERDDAVGTMATFPPWFVDACPWLAAWLAVAAVVDALQGRRAAALPPCCRPDKKCH